jgi:hypothetical protein
MTILTTNNNKTHKNYNTMGDEAYYFEPHPEFNAEKVKRLKQEVDEARKDAVHYLIAVIATGLLYSALHYIGII